MSSPSPEKAPALHAAALEAAPAPPCVAAPPSPAVEGEEFGALYRSTLSPLRLFLARLLGDHAEAQDIAQDAYVKTYEAMQDRPVHQPRSYLFTTARRLALTYRIRRASRMQPTEDSVLESKAGASPDPTSLVMAKQDREAFAAAVRDLPRACQEVLVLRLNDGLTPPEIAQKLGIAESTVSNNLTRALRRVREYVTVQNGVARPDSGTPNSISVGS